MTTLKIKPSGAHSYIVINSLEPCVDSIFPTVTMEIDQESTLSDHLYAFERFLQAIGYVLPENSRLDFVKE